MPKHFLKSLAIAFAVAAMAATFPQTSLAKEKFRDKTRLMTTNELWQMYHNRTWFWSDGAGYFANTGRKFSAYVKSDWDAGIAEGRWFVTAKGNACFRAKWVGVGWQESSQTCFRHRTNGGVIFQRRLPDGKWYVFKHSPVRKGDEFTKLLLGDFVSERKNRNRKSIETLGKR